MTISKSCSSSWRILPRKSPDVSPPPLPADLREKVARFAAGKCSEEERDEMKKLLREQPDLASVLATEVRALRPSKE